MTKIRKNSIRVRFAKGGKYAGGGKNHSAKIIGGKGRRVKIPKTADSFRSKTDHT